ncbi:MAG: MNIO family bufferin maturase [Cellvibrionaceae bacterium]
MPLSKTRSNTALPNTVGVSLKAQHYQHIIDNRPDIGWFEVHPENYMGAGGLPHHFLSQINEHYPISMHGVGLSLGSADGIDENHLAALSSVVKRHQPVQVSEHLAWSHWNNTFLNDLLPVPYTHDFLSVVVNNIHKVQDALQRTLLIENPSVYLGFNDASYTEADFLREVVKQTGCGLLLDINNVYVSANNQGYDPYNYINDYPIEHVGEIHLAGHAQNLIEDQLVLIDDHGSPIIDNVWQLFAYTLKQQRQYPTPVLIEWDTNIPDFSTLLAEAEKAKKLISEQVLEANI